MARFQIAISARVVSSSQVMLVISAHTSPRSMPLSRNQKMATTSTSETTTRMAMRPGRGRLAVAAACSLIVRTPSGDRRGSRATAGS